MPRMDGLTFLKKFGVNIHFLLLVGDCTLGLNQPLPRWRGKKASNTARLAEVPGWLGGPYSAGDLKRGLPGALSGGCRGTYPGLRFNL